MNTTELYKSITVGAVVTEEMAETASALLAKNAERASARKTAESAKRAEANAPIIAEVIAFCDGKTDVLASDLAAAGICSVQKASSVLRGLVADGKATAHDKSIKGKGKQKAYNLVTENEADGEGEE